MRSRSTASTIGVSRPRIRSGGAQSAIITFWSRWKLSIEVSARCSIGESSASAISARPAANSAQRAGCTGTPRRL
jgi:hypothetical protein